MWELGAEQSVPEARAKYTTLPLSLGYPMNALLTKCMATNRAIRPKVEQIEAELEAIQKNPEEFVTTEVNLVSISIPFLSKNV
jgi:hypothetical protein